MGGLSAPANNSFAKNNLFYTPASGHSTIVNTGTGNTVSNNTATPSNNPAFTDGSGSFSLISDFKPTANYTGGTAVPVGRCARPALGIDLGSRSRVPLDERVRASRT